MCDIVNTFCRRILCVRKSTNLSSIYGELGRVPLRIIRQCNMICYWFKILKLPDNNITKSVYNMLKNDANNNITYTGLNWAHHVKILLQSLGHNNLWIQQNSELITFYSLKQRIFDQYYQSWYSNINNSERLSYYRLFKHSFNQEDYLNNIHDRKLRIALCKFRTSSHNLEIEKGRHRNIQRSERTCKLCNQNVVESEYHFLLVCPFLYILRSKFLKPYFCKWPTIYKFTTLMSSSNKKEIFNIAKFIYYANKRRNEAITNN